jgi:hypothetical protein
MAPVPRVTGSKLLVKIGDAGSPETFTADCLINTSRGIQFQTDTNEYIQPDCDNPDDPAWKSVTKDGLSATISGAGMLYTASLSEWFAWFASDDAKNVQFSVNVLLASGGGYWQGAFKLTSFEVTSDGNKEQSTCNVTLVSDGPVAWMDAAA